MSCPKCERYAEMRLGKDILDELEKNNMVVFRSENYSKQPYVIIKLKDEPGAVAGFGNGIYMVTAKDYESNKEKKNEEDTII